jgi:hypothetical protein
MKSFKFKQRGVSFFGFLMVAVVLIFVALFGMKLVPAYIHNAQIGEIFREISADQALRDAPVKDIEEAYRKRAMMNNIDDLKVEDITIEQESGSLRLSANYSVKIPLVGNITLLLEFNPTSS